MQHSDPQRSDAREARAWAAQRTEAAHIHAERLQARRDTEHDRAEALLAEFVAAAHHRELPSQPLRVRGYGGKSSARTPLRGWYLRRDASSGVSTDGNFYVLTAPLNIFDRIRGTHPKPSRPPMVLGAGGKDGETIDLSEVLDRLLPGWRDQR